jgi:2-polyprenyl-3-methyl-5-hydroxy-6-metoxy-1,4-benzoquinol methylase
MSAATMTHAAGFSAAAPGAAVSSEPAGAPRAPEEFCLPAEYRQQTRALTHDGAETLDAQGRRVEYWNAQRIEASGRYQHHVYAWGARLVRERGLRSVVDVGCGPGTKLGMLIAPVCSDVTGLDQPSAVAVARRLGMPGMYGVVDLENGDRERPERTFDLVICADVIEHLLDPDPALGLLARYCHEGSMVLLSTPDRARLRGRGCMVSEKPEHVREWAAPEFRRYLVSRGWEILRARTLPGEDEPASRGLAREWMWRARLVPTSPHRCFTVLCRPAAR